MIITTRRDTIRDSYDAITPHADLLADRFFARLFAQQPSLRALLPRDHWQRAHDLMALLGLVARHAGRTDAIQASLIDFGAKAQRSGVMPQQLGLARQALIDSMRDVLGPHWTPEIEADWSDLLQSITSVVVLGAGRCRARAA